MKKVLIFIGLKLGEIAGVSLAFTLISHVFLTYLRIPLEVEAIVGFWEGGIAGIISLIFAFTVVFLCVVVFVAVIEVIVRNWKLADKLAKKIK